MDDLGGNPLFLETPILRLADAGRGHHCHGEQRYRTGGSKRCVFFPLEGLREVALLRGGKMKLPELVGGSMQKSMVTITIGWFVPNIYCQLLWSPSYPTKKNKLHCFYDGRSRRCCLELWLLLLFWGYLRDHLVGWSWDEEMGVVSNLPNHGKVARILCFVFFPE